MRKIVIFFIACVVLLSSCGITKRYSVAQAEGSIAKIEIVSVKEWYDYTPGGNCEVDVVCEVSEEYHKTFLDDLYNVPCHSYYGSPYDGFVNDTIRITYTDGSFELISEKAVYYESVDGEWTYPSYDFEQEAFEKFLSSWISSIYW